MVTLSHKDGFTARLPLKMAADCAAVASIADALVERDGTVRRSRAAKQLNLVVSPAIGRRGFYRRICR